MKDLFDTDWESELREGDTAVRREGDDEITVVFLAGLQRLARMAGVVKQSCKIITPSPSMVQAIFETTFTVGDREVTFVGTADCSSKNTNGKFLNYPTAVAESRAEARCLRKALGIRMLSSEEVGLREEGNASLEVVPNRKADGQLVKAIEVMLERNGVQPAVMLDAVIPDKDRALSIFKLEDLTVAEAQAAMAWLNEQRPQKPSAKDKRDARKAELLAKQGDNNG